MRDEDLAGFAAAVANRLDQSGLDPTEVDLVAAVDDGEAIDLFVIDDAATAGATAALDQLVTGDRLVAAVVAPIAWSPTDHEPTSPAWLLVAVEGNLPVFGAVRRSTDDRWARLMPRELPWFALSTAAGLRGALVYGEPLRLKHDPPPEHYQRPDDVPRPPVDGRGEL